MLNNSSKLCGLLKIEQNFSASDQLDKIYLFNWLIFNENCKHSEHKTLILVHKLKEHREKKK